MSQMIWRLSWYLLVWMSRNKPITWEQQVPNLTGLLDFAWAMRKIFG